MGIESDKLVYDYLGKVGDLAQTALPAAQRVRLVTQLRTDIDRARGKTAGDSPAAVRRILGRLGSPDEVVGAASGSESGSGSGSRAGSGSGAPVSDSGAGLWSAPPAPPAAPPRVPLTKPAPTAPSAAPAEAAGGVEWWRTAPSDLGSRTNEILAAGWTGGLIMPEFAQDTETAPADGGTDHEGGEAPDAAAPDTPADATHGSRGRPRRLLRGALRLPFRRAAPAPAAEAAPQAARRGLPAGPMEVLAALVLVAGAVFGNAIVLIAGWLLAYTSRGISRREAQFAALGVPGVVTLGAVGWLWGRTAGHWGSRLAADQMGSAFSADVPTLIRVAAVASALYLVWRTVLRRR